MPELPEVETIRRGLARKIIGLRITRARINLAKITNIPPERFISSVKGKTVLRVLRFAKILVIDLSGGLSLAIHLKISGQLIYLEPVGAKRLTGSNPGTKYRDTHLKPSQVKHTHVIFNLSNGCQLRFIDPRQFGYVKLFKTDELPAKTKLNKLGPEPLTRDFTLEVFKERLKRRPRSRIKQLLLDQHFVSGIGNLYADEILFAARINPLRRVKQLKPDEAKRIYRQIKPILSKAIKYKGTSVDSYRDAEGRRGLYLKFVRAYGREGEPCRRCGRPIKRIKLGTRSAYFCPRCQPS